MPVFSINSFLHYIELWNFRTKKLNESFIGGTFVPWNFFPWNFRLQEWN